MLASLTRGAVRTNRNVPLCSLQGGWLSRTGCGTEQSGRGTAVGRIGRQGALAECERSSMMGSATWSRRGAEQPIEDLAVHLLHPFQAVAKRAQRGRQHVEDFDYLRPAAGV